MVEKLLQHKRLQVFKTAEYLRQQQMCDFSQKTEN